MQPGIKMHFRNINVIRSGVKIVQLFVCVESSTTPVDQLKYSNKNLSPQKTTLNV